MPAAVVRFCEEQLLHDADVFGPAWLAEPAATSGGEVVLVAQQVNTLNADFLNTLAFLHYTATEEPRVVIPVPSPVFSQAQPHWLWDEFDRIEPGVFSHSILYSDGRVVSIRFRDFDCRMAKLINPDVFKSAKALPTEEVPA